MIAMKSKYDKGTVHNLLNGRSIEVLDRSGIYTKIKFIDSGEIKNTTINSIFRGIIQSKEEKVRKFKIGEVFKNNKGSEFVVIEVLKHPYLKIKFLDDFGYEREVQPSHIKKGVVNNPYEKSKYGIGYLGDCDRTHSMYKVSKKLWDKMMQRCYDDDYLNNNPSYKNVKVCEEWYNFSNFFLWAKDAYIQGFFMDKDFLQLGKFNKIYSKETCMFVDRKINNFIKISKRKNSNVYKNYHDMWRTECTDFNTGNRITLGIFETKEEARQSYIDFKIKQIDCAKIYMKNQGHYSDEIISNLDKLKELI